MKPISSLKYSKFLRLDTICQRILPKRGKKIEQKGPNKFIMYKTDIHKFGIHDSGADDRPDSENTSTAYCWLYN